MEFGRLDALCRLLGLHGSRLRIAGLSTIELLPLNYCCGALALHDAQSRANHHRATRMTTRTNQHFSQTITGAHTLLFTSHHTPTRQSLALARCSRVRARLRMRQRTRPIPLRRLRAAHVENSAVLAVAVELGKITAETDGPRTFALKFDEIAAGLLAAPAPWTATRDRS